MDFVKLVDTRISIEDITELVKSSRCGAVSLFIGTTRDNCNGLEVAQLEYEAYESMAVKAMKNVCLEMRKKWPNVENIAIYHRLGEVKVKEASIVVAVSSPHRQDSLEAVHFAIDFLKSSVPIWKKEKYVDSKVKAEWKENKECSWSQ
uniref:Molybdopterin synthase catalytic subunit n=1 Tax=Clastoptera arizonana TaxID=38151 RepID=A0A1B6CZU6_9HEMI